ncbi:alpha/beta hydrolase-fold protein [Streptomyces fimicarius]|uniref:alpha/beta hydrolase n=1 Tax=Streptomyces TaxID=1883 RepID=UPI000A3B4A31|nr:MULTISPECIES: alpha/beta hydrolase-fold protein [Streptomyces]MDX2673944.1 alpha/beta hydrolase-fold protein [Streptomyces sp. NRRL_ISP-5395]GHF71545.1 esterase [Streptomyces griseus]
MGLTSTAVLAVVAVLAVALFAATVRFWPRLARPGAAAVSGRIGLLLATQLTLFAAVGLAANNAFLFYGSWADLFGRQQELGVVSDHAGNGPGPRHMTRIDSQHPDVPGGRVPAVGGRIDKVVVSGRTSGIESPAYVYLPPEYFQAAYAGRKFPAVVVLTGYPGTAENLLKGLRYPQTAHERVKAGKAQPMILVMLRPTVAPPRDTECVDVPKGPQTETFFAKDLPEAIAGSYRVGKKARNWGIIGNSTGGYCALKIGLHHPDRYAASAGLSAYYKAAEDPTTGDLFHGQGELRDRADLMWTLENRPPSGGSFLVTTSREGEDNLGDTMTFIEKVKAPAKVSSIVLDSGGHNFTTWRREIPPALEWLSARLGEN